MLRLVPLFLQVLHVLNFFNDTSNFDGVRPSLKIDGIFYGVTNMTLRLTSTILLLNDEVAEPLMYAWGPQFGKRWANRTDVVPLYCTDYPCFSTQMQSNMVIGCRHKFVKYHQEFIGVVHLFVWEISSEVYVCFASASYYLSLN